MTSSEVLTKTDLSMMKKRRDSCTPLNFQVTYKDNIQLTISNPKDQISLDKKP